MYVQEINLKNSVYIYLFDYLFKAKKLETKNMLIDEKTIRIWWFVLLDTFTVSQ